MSQQKQDVKQDVKHDLMIYPPKSKTPFSKSKTPRKSNFERNCQTIKSSLDHINSHSLINKHNQSSDRYLNIALFGPKLWSDNRKHLGTMYDYYTTGHNIEKWAKTVVKQHSIISVISMFDFLGSLEAYFSATLDLTAVRKINKDPNEKSILVYKIWRAHLEDCLKKIDLVLKTL